MRTPSRFALAIAVVVAVLLVIESIGYAAVPSWSARRSADSSASASQVWRWYADPADWPNWDRLVQRVTPNGPFADGTTGWNLSNGIPMSSTLFDVVPNHRYVEVIQAPLATLTATHDIDALPGGGTRIDHGMIVSGPLAWLYAFAARASLVDGMQQALQRLATHASQPPPTRLLP
jgi:hypothetical protein